MLDYTSTESQIPEMNLAEIPIMQLCQKLIKKLQTPYFSDVTVTMHGEDLKIVADEHFIERALENLILNAVRYAKTEIAININCYKQQIQLCIEDDGPGVHADMRDKIFLPFFRPDEGRDRERGGAGLGLAIVKRVATWHQGDCFVTQSKLGGAKFIIQLPDVFRPS